MKKNTVKITNPSDQEAFKRAFEKAFGEGYRIEFEDGRSSIFGDMSRMPEIRAFVKGWKAGRDNG